MADRYRVELLPAAARQLAAAPRPVQRRLESAIGALAENPRPPGVKQLQGPGGVLRLRSGAYRVLYQVFDRRLIVLVIRVGHRREVYRAGALRRLRRR